MYIRFEEYMCIKYLWPINIIKWYVCVPDIVLLDYIALYYRQLDSVCQTLAWHADTMYIMNLWCQQYVFTNLQTCVRNNWFYTV